MNKKKKVLIAGSSGMMGSLVLKNCLESDEIEQVISINRDELTIKDPKLVALKHDDFLKYEKVQEYFENIDVAYYCIGVYTGAVPRDEFRKITVDFTVAFAYALKANSPDAAFVFLSGAGADRTEKSRMMFARDKGSAENYLLQKNFSRLHIFRPGYIHPTTPRKEPNFTYVISNKIYPLLKRIMPNGVIESADLAVAMFEVGINGGELDTYENKDIRKIIS